MSDDVDLEVLFDEIFLQMLLGMIVELVVVVFVVVGIEDVVVGEQEDQSDKFMYECLGGIVCLLYDFMCEFGYDCLLIDVVEQIGDVQSCLEYIVIFIEQVVNKVFNVLDFGMLVQDCLQE